MTGQLRHARTLLLEFTLLAGLLCATPALAATVDGKFGVGFEDTLTAVGIRQSLFAAGQYPDVRPSGLSGHYWIGNVGLEGIVGASVKFGEHLGHAGFLGLGVHYAAFRAPSVNLSIGVRGLFAWANVSTEDDELGTRFGFAVEVPLRVEYFLTPAFAVAAAVGPVLHFPSPWRNDSTGTSVPVRNPLTTGTSTWDLALTRGEFSGGLGFTYYFL